jgi:D-serine deaminase-like pyridoxal phosphate-dependent protein
LARRPVVIDLTASSATSPACSSFAMPAHVANRPHIKTHKSPVLAKMQVAAGAKGITCQKLGEAEVMVEGGLDDILISYNLLGEEKMGRLGALLAGNHHRRRRQRHRHRGPAEAARGRRPPLGVVIECDTGRKRAGVETAQEAIELAARSRSSRPALRGFLFYPTETSWPQTQRFFNERSRACARSGSSRALSPTGGTPNLPNMGKLEGSPSTAPAPTSSTTA